jgi:hypothetical protein
MNQFPSTYVSEAMRKREAALPTTLNERARLARLDAVGRLPVRIPTSPSSPDPAVPSKPTQRIEDIPNLTQKLRTAGGEGTPYTLDPTSVITALISSGATFIEKTGCDSGTPYTYWAPEWTSDPTP